LNGEQYFAFLKTANPTRYNEVLRQAGLEGIKRAEQQLALYYINKNWAEFLEALESVRQGIHFMSLKNDAVGAVIGGMQTTPVLGEYESTVMGMCEQLSEKIKQDIIQKMEMLPITKDGVNLDDAGLRGGTTTLTYAVNEDILQFSRLSSVAKGIRNKLSGENGILTKYYRKKRDKIKNR